MTKPQRPAEACAPKHSALPWDWFDEDIPGAYSESEYVPSMVCADVDAIVVAYMADDVDKETRNANAALIVTAVNERPALLARLAAAEKLAEAAQWLSENNGIVHMAMPDGPPCELVPNSMNCAACALRAALLAFEAPAGTQEGADV